MDIKDPNFSGSDGQPDSSSQSPLSSESWKQRSNERRQLAHRRERLPTVDGVNAALSKSIRTKIIQAFGDSDRSQSRGSKALLTRQLSAFLLTNVEECREYADLFLLIDHDNGANIAEAFSEDADFKIERLRHEGSNLSALQYALEFGMWNAAQAVLQLVRPEFIAATRLINRDSRETETCLHRAIACGQDRLATLLLARLADLGAAARSAYVATDTLIHEWGERLKVSALHLAALGGHLDVVQRLVREERVPAHLPTNSMATAAFLAVRKGHVAVAEWLLEAERSQADLADTAGLTLLHYAVLSDNVAAVRFVLSLSRNVSSQTPSPRRLSEDPLLLAAQRGNADIVQSLLGCPEIGVLLNSKSEMTGNTPLHSACMGRARGDTAVAEVLLTAGADIRSFNRHRETPLMLSAQSGNADTLIAICAHFAKRTSTDDGAHGAGGCKLFDDVSEDGKTVWHYAIEADCGSQSTENVLRSLMEFLNMCYRQRAEGDDGSSSDEATVGKVERPLTDQDVQDFLDRKLSSPSQSLPTPIWNSGLPGTEQMTTTSSPLHIAASIGSLEKLKVLLLPAYSHSYSFFDNKKNNFLHAAAYHGKTQVLLQYCTPTNTNQQNSDGDTPLHIICRGGHFDCVSKLLPIANVKLANKYGCLLLHELCTCNGVTVEILRQTVQHMRDVSWDLLYRRDCKGRTALHILSGRCLSAPAESIFSVFAKSTLIRERDFGGNVPAHVALLAGRIDNFAALLKVFADTLDINARNSDGKTPLILAAERKQVRAVSVQLTYGADLLACDNEGNTALHRLIFGASKHPESVACYLEIIQLLLDDAVTWHCRRRRLSPIPKRSSVRSDSPDEKYWQYFREAVLKLVVLTFNNRGMNAIYLAAQLNTHEVLFHLLQLDGAFVLSEGKRATDSPCGYDVTDMVFNTLSRYDLYRDEVLVSTPKADEVDSCMSPLLRANEVEKQTRKEDGVSASSTRQPALVEVIVNNGYQDCWKLLDIPAIDRVTTDYWTPYRWLYIFNLILHVVYMTVLSYAATRTLGVSRAVCYSPAGRGAGNATGVKSAVAFGNGTEPAASVGNNSITTQSASESDTDYGSLAMDAQDVLTMLFILAWPTALLLRCGLFVAFTLAHSERKPKETLSLLLSGIALHPVAYLEQATSLVLPLVYSCLVVAWSAILVFWNCSSHYVLAVALLLGWVYTVHFTSGFAGLHHFAAILQRIVFRDLSRFVFAFALLTAGFSLAFLVASRAAEPIARQLPSVGFSVFAVLKAWVGAGDVVDMSGLSAGQHDETRSFLSALYVMCMISMAVVMTNMLIAMMSDSYHDIYIERKLVWRIESLKTANRLDRHYPFLGKALRRVMGSDKKIVQDVVFVDGQPLRRFVMLAENCAVAAGGRDPVRPFLTLSNSLQLDAIDSYSSAAGTLANNARKRACMEFASLKGLKECQDERPT